MASDLHSLITALEDDPKRRDIGFSPDLYQTQEVFLDAGLSDEEIRAAADAWLARSQPCIFGRLAAANGRLRYCILREDDLRKGDAHVRDKIQAARLRWSRDAIRGDSSGFLVLLLSRRLAEARPSQILFRLASRLCSLYLLEEVRADTIHLEQVFLRMPGHRGAAWVWSAGVNIFMSQGDRRWWHDHRFPGGLAFSINSVGHMVKSSVLGSEFQRLAELVGVNDDSWSTTKIKDFGAALALAMRTIAKATVAISGPATYLIPRVDRVPPVECPIALPSDLAEKDCCEYRGFYHTDFTVPSLYFLECVERPEATAATRLDFTYLFDRGADNLDYFRMGEGRRIEADETLPPKELNARTRRFFPDEIDAAGSERLAELLAGLDGKP